jgi:hypothetical protein
MPFPRLQRASYDATLVRAYRDVLFLHPADARSVHLLAALASEGDELADALAKRGVDVATLVRTYLRPGSRRTFRRLGSKELQRVLVDAGGRAIEDGRSLISRVDFLRAVAAQRSIDSALTGLGLRGSDLEEIADDLSH